MKKAIATFVTIIGLILFVGCGKSTAIGVYCPDLQEETITELETNTTTNKVTSTKEFSTTTSISTTVVTLRTSTTATATTVVKIITTVAPQKQTYTVFSPSTHYIHSSNCREVTSECYPITETETIRARKCTICNPTMEILNEYIPTDTNTAYQVTEYDKLLLCKIVSQEYGADWVSIPEKAKIVAAVMNRVYDSRFPNSVLEVLTQKRQFGRFNPNKNYYMSSSIVAAVEYYFENPQLFGKYNSWNGDGRVNHFYYQ